MNAQIPKNLKRRIFRNHLVMMLALAVGIIPVYLFLNNFAGQDDSALLWRLLPIFLYLLYFYLVILVRSKMEQNIIEQIHDSYAEQLKGLSFAKLSTALTTHTFIPNVIPKIFRKIIMQNEIWDNDNLPISSAAILKKTKSNKIADIKLHYDLLTSAEKNKVDNAIHIFITAKVITSPPDISFKTLGIH